jgi:predicted ATPase
VRRIDKHAAAEVCKGPRPCHQPGALHVAGEQVWAVPPLDQPEPADSTSLETLHQVEGVRLFVERARASRPGFDLDERNARAIAQLCRMVDGLPLAIEVAAAQVRAFAPHQLLNRTDHRFRLPPARRVLP